MKSYYPVEIIPVLKSPSPVPYRPQPCKMRHKTLEAIHYIRYDMMVYQADLATTIENQMSLVWKSKIPILLLHIPIAIVPNILAKAII